jgi:acetoin utilization protein AcuB
MTDTVDTPAAPTADANARWTAADVMSAPVATIAATARLSTAWSAIYRSGRRHLVVISNRQCVGVVDDRRIGLEWPMGELRAAELTVGEITRRDTSTVGTSTAVAEIAQLMIGDGVDAVPVLSESGELVGLVTGSDLIALMAYGRPRGSASK